MGKVKKELQFDRKDTVDSTNDVAIARARSGWPEGLVITAKQQLNGRGRRGAGWYGLMGQSVLMSMILAPDKPQRELPQLSLVASLSVAELLRETLDLDAMLKWPNDVFVNGRKIAGILVEVTSYQNMPRAIVGIGLNVNQTEFPLGLSDIATSVLLESGSERDVDQLCELVAYRLIDNYERYLSSGFEDILARWRNYMWGIGSRTSIQTEGRTVEGIVSGLDPTGALLVTDGSAQHVITAADTIRLMTDN